MKQKFAAITITTCLILFLAQSLTQAALVTIGTATSEYIDGTCNLIWDDDNNGNSLIWLDYTYPFNNWWSVAGWGDGLENHPTHETTYTWEPTYTVTWDDDTWRDPSSGVNPQAGYDQTTSEMGHLFYVELGLSGGKNIAITTEELNGSNFDNLVASWYWSGTESTDPGDAWYFVMGGESHSGHQGTFGQEYLGYGLAVRSGQVSTSSVPVPGSLLLLGSGLAGFVGLSRRRKRSRC